jgi:hypothetical protein
MSERQTDAPWEMLSSAEQLAELDRRKKARSNSDETQRIVIPLYDHAPNAEVLEILERLDELGFSIEPRFERHSARNDRWDEIDRRELRAFADR